MILDLTHIRHPETPIDREFAPDAVSTDDFRVLVPVRLTAVLHKDKERYRLVGQFTTRLELPCSRCLDPFEVAVDTALDLRYLPQTMAGDKDEDPTDDPSTTFYQDDQLDLGLLVREQCYLALPMKPLCRESCQGLCPMCGTNLNLERCDCRPQWTDPRLAALQSLVSPRTNDDA